MQTIPMPPSRDQLEEIERIAKDPNAHVNKMRCESIERNERLINDLLLRAATGRRWRGRSA